MSASATSVAEVPILEMFQQLNADMASVVERVRGSLVQISNGRRGHGAGTIWHPAGLILTNAHVVAGRSSLRVSLPDGETLPAKILAADPDLDLEAKEPGVSALTIDGQVYGYPSEGDTAICNL